MSLQTPYMCQHDADLQQLAVELACQFNGEIINADAMQMYKGLPVITNKISVQEQRGIPHHLLSHIDLNEDTWDVGLFRKDSSKIIREVRSRGKLPIVVGGTHYYLDGLLFEDHLVRSAEGDAVNGAAPSDAASQHPILAGPIEAVIAKLQEVDPVMADRWHPNDHRKIRRSLEIYFTTGKRASDIYAKQVERKALRSENAESPWQSLLLWVYAKPEVLNKRLDERVNKMMERGLIEETHDIYDYLQHRYNNGDLIDRTKGIWQSIGFKEMEPFIEGSKLSYCPDKLEELKQAGLDRMKIATRHYAKYQVRWINKKTVRLLREEDALDHLFVLDSTDVSHWSENVAHKATNLTRLFLDGAPLPSPSEMSTTAAHVLASAFKASDTDSTKWSRRTCELCNVTLLTEELWVAHIKGNRHRRIERHKKRSSLVPVGRSHNALISVGQNADDRGGKLRDEDAPLHAVFLEPNPS
jgi:tRNA dimethylallyltransferase